nr:GntR family transcriptional regulator [Clostridium sp. 1001275B_160808_H3]
MYIYSIYTSYTIGGEKVDIVISNSSQVPLYEQIENQIKNQIINLTLEPGEALPSIRTLAKELKVSIITTKRAYEELEKEGFIKTVVGKGTFVAEANNERLKEVAMFEIENKLEEAIISAKAIGLTLDEALEIFKSLYEEV